MPMLKVKTQVCDAFRIKAGNHKYHDDDAIADVIDYVLRNDKTEPEFTGGMAVNVRFAKEQFEIVAKACGKDFGTRLRHMILSFSPNERITVLDAKNIAYQVAGYYGYLYQIIWSVHLDSGHIHIHMVMNTVSYRTGLKYDGSKEDYYRFIDYVNGVLAPYGMYAMVCSDKNHTL